MSSRSDIVCLVDMLDSIGAIEQFVAGFDTPCEDEPERKN
jgi:hypothetical protein